MEKAANVTQGQADWRCFNGLILLSCFGKVPLPLRSQFPLWYHTEHYFANKDPSSQTMVYPVVMYGCYGCESWTVKKVEHLRIDAFELWCWKRLLRVP